MRAAWHDRRAVSVAKATKATKTTKRVVQHTWKVTRRNNQVIEITADSLTVVYGDLVFSTRGIVVRVIGVDTYNDVELVSPLEP
jgi:hypothetical protein